VFALCLLVASGLMLTRPDSFIPPVDVVVEDGFYTIYMDVPGLSAKGNVSYPATAAREADGVC